MTELTLTINNVNDLSTAQSDISSLKESINTNTTNITTLQNELIVEGTNLSVGEAWSDMSYVDYNMGVGVGALGTKCTLASECNAVGYNAMNSITTGGNNTTIGSQCLPNITAGFNSIGLGFLAGGEVTTGHGNTLIGTASALALTMGYDNTVVGNNTNVYADYCSESIVLGAWCTNTASNQLYVSPSITLFNISGLITSMGTGVGTIMEFDSSGNIIPSTGTYNMVSKIDTTITSINAPYAFSWYQTTTISLDISITSQPLALWTISSFGESGNMVSATTWTCPATGLWSFKTSFGYQSNTTNITIYLQLLQNSNEVANKVNWYLNPEGTGSPNIYYDNLLNMTKGDTLEWQMTQAYNPTDATVTLQFTSSTFVGLMIAPGYTAA